ncbi:MAG: pyruvate synthase subunit beta [Thermoprotei archaeon]|nr:MAG: pyruvate synthase subunit beta [Thermoprotei archaeon]RLE88238.1 MAG: pyruvate synthase subunit beta [Thermoprotei archaeon]
MTITIKSLSREEYLLPGNASCPGCPASLGLRLLGKALGKNMILVVPASCTSIIQGPYPKTSIKLPLINVIFASSAATASGIAAALEILGKKGVHVVCWSGDGGTVDIGLQALSGAAERGDNILYICYDNEAYMNTGIQRSGSTPYGAWTTTTVLGKRRHKKNLPMMMVVHDVPYVATASIGYPLDFIEKIRKAARYKGFKYIHLLAPCPVGWRFPPSKTIEIGRLAVLTGMWPLYEVERGKFRLTGVSRSLLDKSKRSPIVEYIKIQGRFSHISEEEIRILEEYVDKLWEDIRKIIS